MAAGFPVKANYATGDVLSATNMNDLSGTVNLINPTAKGDLYAGSAANTYTKLAVGNNGETLVADSSTSTGLRYTSNFAAGKNKFINGDFSNWQRGTSFTLTTATDTFCADRFMFAAYGTSTAGTVTRQAFTPGTAPVAGYEGSYFARLTNFATATAWQIRQRIENVQTFAGQTVTFSFWAKSGTAITNTLNVELIQYYGASGSGTLTTAISSSGSITTSWARYSYTVTVPSLAGKTLGANSYADFNVYQTSGVTNANTIDTWGWQVEAGSVATAFQTATGTIQGELSACQRYYWRFGADATYPYAGFGSGSAASTTQATIICQNPVPMRVPATSIDGNQLGLVDGVNGVVAVTGTVLAQLNPFQSTILANVSSGLTQYRWYRLSSNNSSTGYIGFSAEL